MNKPQRIALVCDYLRSKKADAPEYIDYALCIENIFERTLAQETADELLDTVESLNAEAVGEFFLHRLVSHHYEAALNWKAEQRSAA